MERAGQRGNIGKVTVKITSVPIVEHTVCRGRGDPASAERDNYIRGGHRIARNHDIADLLGVQRASPYAEGNIGTDRRAERAERVSVERMPRQRVQSPEHRCGIGAASREPRRHRYVLLNIYSACEIVDVTSVEERDCGAVREVSRVARKRGFRTAYLNALKSRRGGEHFNGDLIAEIDRLHHAFYVVISVRSFSENVKIQIDFRRGGQCDFHCVTVLSV